MRLILDLLSLLDFVYAAVLWLAGGALVLFLLALAASSVMSFFQWLF